MLTFAPRRLVAHGQERRDSAKEEACLPSKDQYPTGRVRTLAPGQHRAGTHSVHRCPCYRLRCFRAASPGVITVSDSARVYAIAARVCI